MQEQAFHALGPPSGRAGAVRNRKGLLKVGREMISAEPGLSRYVCVTAGGALRVDAAKIIGYEPGTTL